MLDDSFALLIGEGLELDRRPAPLRPVGSVFEEVRARCADQEQWAGRSRLQMLDQIEKGGLRPVDVFEGDYDRLLGGLQLEQLARTPEDFVQREAGLGQSDCRGHACNCIFAARARDAKELCAGLLGCVVIADRGRVADDFHQRPERDPTTVRKTSSSQHSSVALDSMCKLLDQARLADARLSNERYEPA